MDENFRKRRFGKKMGEETGDGDPCKTMEIPIEFQLFSLYSLFSRPELATQLPASATRSPFALNAPLYEYPLSL